jgi:crotonobetainyl-CoA:carnitine CoA-transferase CaiB-like acyl-CoA transferase
MSNVMEGVRILEVAEHTFVPAAAAILSDWGAEVIKIEHVERGDAMRGLATTAGMSMFGTDVHVLLEHSNRGKKSLALDLTTPEGRDIVYRLAATADVFLTNKMPGVRTKLEIDVDDIRAHNPRIIYVRGSGYGAHGPDADAGGYDSLGYWYRGGSAMGAAPPGASPTVAMPGPAYGDSIGAMTIAGGISAALFHREHTGEADIVDVSLLSTGVWTMGGAVALSLQMNMPWRGMAVGTMCAPTNPLTGIYPTADDDKFLAFSMLQGAHYWPEVCARLGLDEYATDSRFADTEALAANTADAYELVAAVVVQHTLAEWKVTLQGMKGQWAPLQDTLDLETDPQVVANGYLQALHTRTGKPYTLASTPVQFNGVPSPIGRAPDFNEHGDEILTEGLGIDWDTIIDWKVRGIVA